MDYLLGLCNEWRKNNCLVENVKVYRECIENTNKRYLEAGGFLVMRD